MKKISKLKADIHKNFQYAKTIEIIIVEYSPSMFRLVPWIDTTTKVVSYHYTIYNLDTNNQSGDVAM